MTTPSLFQSLGLSLSVFEPTIYTGSYNPRGRYLYDIIDDVSTYEHTIEALGGFASASVTLSGNQLDVEDWIANSLGRHVEVHDAALDVAWEGFVNAYSAQVGPLAVTGGPLMDVANRVVVKYKPIDPTADPPAAGPETETVAAEDADSQARYGILETVFSGGQDTQAGAERTRDTLLADVKDPPRSERIAPGGQETSITLECLGYGAFLDRYVFNDATPAVESITAKIVAALAADPNGLFSTDISRIDTNPFLVAARERDDRTAWSVIQALVAKGDATDTRWFFGIYDGQMAYYNAAPTVPEYQHRIGGMAQQVERYGSGTLVRPWDVKPGQWLFLPDYLVGRTQPVADLRSDPRNVLIESVRYTAPYDVELNGQRFGRLPQLLAKKGLGGI